MNGAVDTSVKKERQLIAPWWHTLLMIAPIAFFSVMGGGKRAQHSLGTHHVAQYLSTMAFEWVLAGIALWGIRMKKVPLRQLLGERRSGIKAWFTDVGVAALFWIWAMAVLAAIGLVLKLAHFTMPEKTIAGLAPHNAVELLLWILLSVSAGICEELVFRGYLLQQFTRMSGKVWVGVLCSSLLFGGAHGYEGAGGMIAITAYGAMFCVLAIKRRSLRAGMMAHAWHDSITGVALIILKHVKAI